MNQKLNLSPQEALIWKLMSNHGFDGYTLTADKLRFYKSDKDIGYRFEAEIPAQISMNQVNEFSRIVWKAYYDDDGCMMKRKVLMSNGKPQMFYFYYNI